jgi:hypothetical protein
MSYGNHINYSTGQPCDCSLAIYCGHYYRDGVAFVSMSPADILAAVRTLPGVTTAETVMDHKRFRSWYIPMDEPGRYLVVPLSEEE